jgi:hypothetical protein
MKASFVIRCYNGEKHTGTGSDSLDRRRRKKVACFAKYRCHRSGEEGGSIADDELLAGEKIDWIEHSLDSEWSASYSQ